MHPRVLSGLALIFCPFGFATAETFCVHDSVGFQEALDGAAVNGEDNVIKVTEGFYSPSSVLNFQPTQSKSITIEGGYQTTAQGPCAGHEKRPNLTVLDGGESHPVLRIFRNSTPDDITIRDLTIQNGLAVDNVVPLMLGGPPPWSGKLTVERLIVRENRSNVYCALFQSGGGETTIRDNAFVNNETSAGNSALNVDSSPGTLPVALTNLTVSGNRTFPAGSPSYGLGLFGQDTQYLLTNNIIWGNVGTDLRIASLFVNLVNNDIGTTCCTSPLGTTGGISVDPGFLASNDHRLSGSSPARDAGIDNPVGNVGPYDINGDKRIVFGTVDMGAYEIQDLLFANGAD